MTPNYFRFVKKDSSEGGGSGLSSVMPSTNLALLLDPSTEIYSDNGSTAATNGDDVFRIDDQSSTGTNALAGGTSKPVFYTDGGSTWNNRPYIQFADGNRGAFGRLEVADNAAHRGLSMTVYLIMNRDDNSDTQEYFLSKDNYGDTGEGWSLKAYGAKGFNHYIQSTAYKLRQSNASQPDEQVLCMRWHMADAGTNVTHTSLYGTLTQSEWHIVNLNDGVGGNPDTDRNRGWYDRQNNGSFIPNDYDSNDAVVAPLIINGNEGSSGIGYGGNFKFFGLLIYDTFHTDAEVATNQAALNTYFGGNLWS